MNTEILDRYGNSHKSIKSHILHWLNELEDVVTSVASRLAPWLAPISPAYFVGRAAITHLQANIYIAVLMAIALEAVGLSAIHCTLRCWSWNQTKRKTDPKAPFALTILLSSLYFLSTLTLTVVVEVYPQAVTYAPAIFIVLTGCGYISMAVNWKVSKWEDERKAEHYQRQSEKDQVFSTVKAARQEVARLTESIDTLKQQKFTLEAEIKTLKQQQKSVTVADHPSIIDAEDDSKPARTRVNTKDRAYEILMDIYRDGGEISGSELGRQLQRSPGLGRQLKADLLPKVLVDLQADRQC